MNTNYNKTLHYSDESLPKENETVLVLWVDPFGVAMLTSCKFKNNRFWQKKQIYIEPKNTIGWFSCNE